MDLTKRIFLNHTFQDGYTCECELFYMTDPEGNPKLVTWISEITEYLNEPVYYIGVTDGLGGYRKLLLEGWTDNRIFEEHTI